MKTGNKSNEVDEVSEGPIQIEKNTKKPTTKSGVMYKLKI